MPQALFCALHFRTCTFCAMAQCRQLCIVIFAMYKKYCTDILYIVPPMVHCTCTIYIVVCLHNDFHDAQFLGNIKMYYFFITICMKSPPPIGINNENGKTNRRAASPDATTDHPPTDPHTPQPPQRCASQTKVAFFGPILP